MDKTLNDDQEEEKKEKRGKNEDQWFVFIKFFRRRVQKW